MPPLTPAAPRPHHAIWPSRLPKSLAIPETSVWFNLEVSARRFPDKPAYLFLGRTMSFRELHAQAEALAGWLQSRGVNKGDRVLLYLQNCPQWSVAFHAIQRADAVVVPVNPMNRADEFGHYITDPEARVAIISVDLVATVQQANERLPPGKRLTTLLATRFTDAMPAPADVDEAEKPAAAVFDWLCADPPLPPDVARWTDALAAGQRPTLSTAAPDDLCVLPYTSGTTGLPKGCMHSHRTLMANVAGSGLWGQASAESVALGVVPMFHITGLMVCVLSAAFLGSTTVLSRAGTANWPDA